MSEPEAKKAAAREAIAESQSSDARLRDLISINEEIVELFYTQTYSPDAICSPADVCVAFAQILRDHWKLCCISIYLRDEDNALRLSAMHGDGHFDRESARKIGAQLVEAVEREGRELQFRTNEEHGEAETGETETAEAETGEAEIDSARLPRTLHAATEPRAGLAIPIHARGNLVGTLVVITLHPERLRAALDGLRFIAPLIVIAVGNARRAQAMREQHGRIAELVEQSRERGRELEEANRELRHVAHYRSLFLSRMSHELRTPLTSMLGFAEILLDHEKLTDTQRRFCEKIQSSGMQLQTSLNQLVDLSRL
ncbi:MAG TPA: histidine kinase dimerization/phospho-acceptor domain-containing protein, partial [Pyrinomonadaceae bacterium]